jgi:hypothetical protein
MMIDAWWGMSQDLYFDIALGDRVEMRKPHPCGGRIWQVVRVGADIGMVCETCGRRVMLDRRTFAKRTKRRLPAPDNPSSPS